MLRSLHISRTGLDAQQTQLDVISNNLANVSTTGFKKARAVFEDLLYQIIRQPGAQSSQQTQLPSGFQLGVRPVATERIFTQGSLQQTQNALDVAISGKGFFQIQLPDGSTAFTRDGSFQVDSQGNIVTASGYAVLPNMQVPQDALLISIARDGVVSVTLPGNPNTISQLGQIQLATFINPAGLQSQGENLFIETAASGPAQVNNPETNGLGSLNQSFIETSNVNVAEELVNMIVAQRAYELNSRAITTSDQMLQRLTQI